jgi:hypothetical protein
MWIGPVSRAHQRLRRSDGRRLFAAEDRCAGQKHVSHDAGALSEGPTHRWMIDPPIVAAYS